MAFNNSPGRAEYTATAGQTVFIYVFKIYNTSDIKVYLTPVGQVADDAADLLTLGVDYTVVITGDVGGTVTLLTPATIGDSITLLRTLEIDRQIEYQTSGDLLADTLNQDQNYQTYLIADKESDNLRFLKLPESSQGVSTEIPPPTPLNFFQWNAAGTAIINVDSLQADGFLWTAADVYTKTELNSGALDTRYYTETEVDAAVSDRRKLYAAETVTHDIAVDANYTLTAEQNKYGRIIITDTTIELTGAINVITDNIQKSFIFQNDTLQDITVKTAAGTGIIVLSGSYQTLQNDGTNIISLDPKTFGTSQTLQNVTGSRTIGVTYTNTTNLPIWVTVETTDTGPNALIGSVDGNISHLSSGGSVVFSAGVNFMVPSGSSYVVTDVGGVTLVSWRELRE